MNYREFENRFKNENSFDKYWNYFISISAIIGGTFLLYKLHFSDWYETKSLTHENIAPKKFIYYGIGFIISLGMYGIWRIPKLYEIITIKTSLSLSEKNRILKTLKEEFNFQEQSTKENFSHYKYIGKFRNPFSIYIFIDTDKISFNVQQVSIYSGGYIDFGASKRVKKEIIRKLTNKIIASA